MKNWKTTLLGALTAAGAGMAQVSDEKISMVGKLLACIGPLLMGFFAKDKDVTGAS